VISEAISAAIAIYSWKSNKKCNKRLCILLNKTTPKIPCIDGIICSNISTYIPTTISCFLPSEVHHLAQARYSITSFSQADCTR